MLSRVDGSRKFCQGGTPAFGFRPNLGSTIQLPDCPTNPSYCRPELHSRRTDSDRFFEKLPVPAQLAPNASEAARKRQPGKFGPLGMVLSIKHPPFVDISGFCMNCIQTASAKSLIWHTSLPCDASSLRPPLEGPMRGGAANCTLVGPDSWYSVVWVQLTRNLETVNVA